MITKLPPPAAASSSSSTSTAHRLISTLHWTPKSPPSLKNTNNPFRVLTTSNPSHLSLTTKNPPHDSPDQTLLSLLRLRKTEQAWLAYTNSPDLPSPTCLSRLVCQLSYLNTPLGLSRAQSIIQRLRNEGQLHRLDTNALGLLAVSAAKSGNTLYATSIIKSMLKSGYFPHVKAWSAVVSRLASSGDNGPSEAIKLFKSVTRRIRRLADPARAEYSRPDTVAYNSVLNACANLGLKGKICLCWCWKECMSTLHSLVAAYIGFGDLETAERMVQAMREGRLDLCKVLRDSSLETINGYESDDVFEKLLPNIKYASDYEPPLLPKVYSPNTRMYTIIMKGYLKEGRVKDMVRMLEAMRNQEDRASHPDHVSYTTVVSAFVKIGAMDKAREVLDEMTRIGVRANLITYNILLKGCCQQLQIDKAEDIMKEMVDDAGIEPDAISYNTLIDGCILVDDSAGALGYFNEMRTKGIAPSKVSYTTLMKAFALSGQPKLAGEVFEEMIKDPRVTVDMAAWNMLVEGYCRLGMINPAKEIIARMKENGFYLPLMVV